MSSGLAIPLDALTPDELADARLVELLDRLALERRVRARYADLLPRWGWYAALKQIAEEEPVSYSTAKRIVWGG